MRINLLPAVREFINKHWLVLLLATGFTGYLGYQNYEKSQATAKWMETLSGTRASGTTLEKSDFQSDGMSRECKRQEKRSGSHDLEARIAKDQAELSQRGVLTVIAPTNGPLGAKFRLVSNHQPTPASYPLPSVDILAQLGVTLENQYAGDFGITDQVIRGLTDRAYSKLGIADEGLRGWTLSIRLSESGINMTSLDEDKKLGVISLLPPNFERSAEHEIAHFLSGPGFIKNKGVATVAMEFVAIAAETLDPAADFRDHVSYQAFNLGILGTGRTINGESGVIHAANAPLDGVRYDLLRTTDELIGEDGQVKLAQAVYSQAMSQGSLSMGDMEKLFIAAGVTDCQIFRETMEPGLYLDLTFLQDGTPVMLAKTIDQDGYEGLTQTSQQFIWRNSENQAIAGGEAGPISPFSVLGDATSAAREAAALETRIGGEVYTFQLKPTVSNSSTADHQSTAPSATSFR